MKKQKFEIGKQYRDTEEIEEGTCILEFVRYNFDGDSYFKEISNVKGYIKDDEGLIAFFGEPSMMFEHK